MFWQAYGHADDHTWTWAHGWALALALVFLTHSADNPLIAGIGSAPSARCSDKPGPRGQAGHQPRQASGHATTWQ